MLWYAFRFTSQLTRRSFATGHPRTPRCTQARSTMLNGVFDSPPKDPRTSRLNAEARKANVASAFRIRKRILSDDVLIVDDVYTTGATSKLQHVSLDGVVFEGLGLVSAYVDGPRIRMDTSN